MLTVKKSVDFKSSNDDIWGPTVKEKEKAMKLLGIGKRWIGFRGGGISISVPLSSYTEEDILEAFRTKLSIVEENNPKKDLHESYQLVRRCMKGKGRFKAIGKASLKSQRFACLLGKLKQIPNNNNENESVQEEESKFIIKEKRNQTVKKGKEVTRKINNSIPRKNIIEESTVKLK
ncbi:uncharacterized protein LOC111718229 [Eurytemora carolleeae]|uniref:uncharacterized protein LOC111718229 n=1 Tax=Eurytemora carolleeae TaxID=1294199 RepID=UPI000C77E55B|nr:uncharacterized protein LOC111718229 [Eurytemora carolleeae]|eukprot:XP_023349539.1 uncharacterized protein LOC111718229 [Eurytemora affinis]